MCFFPEDNVNSVAIISNQNYFQDLICDQVWHAWSDEELNFSWICNNNKNISDTHNQSSIYASYV